jgi:serine/threonine protein kinase
VILAIDQGDNSQWALKISQSGDHLKEEAILRHVVAYGGPETKRSHLPRQFHIIPTVGLALPKLAVLSTSRVKQWLRTSENRVFHDVIIQVITALEELHHLGVIHSDIKPENIGIDSNDQVCLIDFDLSSHRSRRTRRIQGSKNPQNISRGTPFYASLRLHFGGQPNDFDDAESAIFSLWEVISPTGLPWEELVNQGQYYRQSDLIQLKTTTPGIPGVLGQLLTYVRETSKKKGGKLDYNHLRNIVKNI